MTKAKATATATATAKAIRMPGKKSPAASRSPIQRPPPAEPHPRNLTRYTKPSDSQPIRPAAEGLDHRFLRSQPRGIGPGSLRKARPRRSEYYPNMHPKTLNIRHNSNDLNYALPKHPAAR